MSGANSWAFNQLNLLSPLETSPANGTSNDNERNEYNLSYPISSSALQAQLEQWTNVAFDFGADSGTNTTTPEEERTKTDGMGLGLERDLLHPMAFHSALGGGRNAGRNDAPGYGLMGNGLAGPSGSSTLDPALSDLFAINNYGTTPISTLPLPSTSTSSSIIVPPSLVNPEKPSPKPTKKRAQSTIVLPAEFEGEDQFPPLILGSDEAINAIAIEEDKRRRNTAASGTSPVPLGLGLDPSLSFRSLGD